MSLKTESISSRVSGCLNSAGNGLKSLSEIFVYNPSSFEICVLFNLVILNTGTSFKLVFLIFIQGPRVIPPIDNKNKDPYVTFYHFIAKKLGGIPKGKTVDVSCCYMTEKTHNKIRKVEKDWAKKAYRLRGKSLDLNLAYHDLDIGPATFYFEDVPGWAKDDVVYVKKGFFTNKTR